MLFAIKIIGGFCVVAIPMGVCGTQALLTKREQEHHKQAIDSEIKKTQNTLLVAQKNYQEQITRINNEKNELFTTKESLTYKPVVIQGDIDKLVAAKQEYEQKHTQTQTDIANAISAHEKSVESAKSEIETLWTNEKNRVAQTQKSLESQITTAKGTNTTLQQNIDALKSEIDATINGVFSPSAKTP